MQSSKTTFFTMKRSLEWATSIFCRFFSPFFTSGINLIKQILGIDNIKNGFNTLNLTIKSANMCLLIVKKLKKSKKAQPENIILHKF